MKNRVKNHFFYQALVSSIPSSFLYITAPLILKSGEDFLTKVGSLFLIIRLLSMLGAINAPRWHQLFSLKTILIFIDSISIILLVTLLWFYHSLTFEFLLLSLGLRSYLSGVTQNTRKTWLKNLPDHNASTKITVEISIAQQGAFLLIGLILIVFKSNENLFRAMVYFDIISLFVSLLLLYRFDKIEIHAKKEPFFSFAIIKKFIISIKLYKNLIFIAIFLSFGISGTNTMLVHFGQKYLSNEYGYGIAICIYSIAFYIGAKLLAPVNILLKSDKWCTIASIYSFGMIGSLFCIELLNTPILTGMALILFFCFYGGLYSLQEEIWFKSISKSDASFGFSVKEIMIGVIIAFGEWFYPKFISNEILIRSLSFTFLLFTFLLSSKKIKHN